MLLLFALALSVFAKAELDKFATNYRYFAAKCQKIIGKGGGAVISFIFNSAQLHLYKEILAMWQEVGYVRIIVVKGRQQGISTIIIGFFHWLALFIPNFTICIISHEAKSTRVLYEKLVTFHENLPQQIKLEVTASHINEYMHFANGSKIIVFTAGEEETGRSQTAQAQHQSERAFFSNPEKIDAGIGQIVAKMKNTFLFKESTGNGMNGFYKEVLDAVAKKGVYRVVFIPWFWQPEYKAKVPPNFERTEYEQQIADLYGITDEQLQWRREIIADELKTEKRFKQEYPNTLMEAFQASGSTFYDPDLIARARASTIRGESFSPLILGVDPGREGDRTVLALRKGREVIEIIKYDTMEQMQLAGIIADLVTRRSIDRVFIDYGMGHGTVDRLRERGFGALVEGVYFGEAPTDSQYMNKRAEMAFAFDDWLKDGEVSLPDDDDMAADIASMPDVVLTSNSRKKFPSKDEIKKNYGRSPDILDAIMLTFAYPVASKEIAELSHTRILKTENTKGGSEINALREIRQKKEGFEWDESEDLQWWQGEPKVRR